MQRDSLAFWRRVQQYLASSQAEVLIAVDGAVDLDGLLAVNV
jgi:hypothetical protein